MDKDAVITIRTSKDWKAKIKKIARDQEHTPSSLIRKEMNAKYPELTNKEGEKNETN